jgi:hypothetical protein
VVLDHPDLATTRRITNALADRPTNGCIGRQLPRLLRQAGLHGVQVEPASVICPPLSLLTAVLPVMLSDRPDIIDPAGLQAWLAPLQEADETGRLWACVGFIVSGTR